ncbi:GntR family transcriptional regulator [Bacillus sp. FJAT-49711]|uniref:GntR family transcriptional regulator n=1 Tax=Bacillus sp. FJAT-49711 TaxID=2833585 RepID=UPI001BCA334E|nr:GntR family transcriptional regulator [Bacillus sp. FJAT-49711]MBS4219033.1 GntR family transcriptional regulator [Bacillus sp. FJAT-49711]
MKGKVLGKVLDNTSVIPLYYQLQEILKENIESRVWRPEEAIPSENQLMKDYNISRNTVIKAIENLVQEGVLIRIQGKGTFVSKPKFEQSLSGFYSFSKIMKESGIEPRDEITSFKVVSAKYSVAEHLQIEEGDPVIELRRIRYADNEPMILETSYVPEQYFPGLKREPLEQSSLYDLMQNEYGIYVIKAKEIFEPVLIREYESKLLQVEVGFPALLLDRIAYDSTEKPVEFCRSIVRGDRCRFYTELL